MLYLLLFTILYSNNYMSVAFSFVIAYSLFISTYITTNTYLDYNLFFPEVLLNDS